MLNYGIARLASARANRQLLGTAVAAAFRIAAGSRLELVYDISHNLATIERHEILGESRELCVHRKGATRALPASVCHRRMVSGVTAESPRSSWLMRSARQGAGQSAPR